MYNASAAVCVTRRLVTVPKEQTFESASTNYTVGTAIVTMKVSYRSGATISVDKFNPGDMYILIN